MHQDDFLKRVNCQYPACNRQNKAQFFCDEPYFQYRFLCQQCSLKFLHKGMIELDTYQDFKKDFLTKHVENTHKKVLEFKQQLDKNLKEIKDLGDALGQKIQKTLNFNLDYVEQRYYDEGHKLELMRYLRVSFDFLTYKNKYKEEFLQATLKFKFVVSNLLNMGEELGFAKIQDINNQNIDDYLKTSLDLFKETKYQESLDKCNDYLVMKPDVVTMQFRKAQCLTKLGKYKEAIKYLEIIEVNNNVQNVEKFDFYLYYGRCLHKMKKFNDALNKFQISLSQQKLNPELYLHVANTLIKLNYLDEAESVFKIISVRDFEQDRGDKILYYRQKAKLLMKTCKDQENFNDVVEKLEQTIEHDAQDIKILYTLGLIKQHCLKFNEAIRYFNDILIIQPNHQKSQQLILKIQRQKRLQQGIEKKSFSLCDFITNCCRRNSLQFIEL